MLLQFPRRRHTRASTGSAAAAGLKKASIGTSLPDNSLSRLARPKDASLRPAKMLRRCDSEQATAAATSGTVLPFRSAQASIGCRSDMERSISTGNNLSQPEIFPLEIRNKFSTLVKCGMGKTPLKQKARPPEKNRDLEPLYVREWIDALSEQHKVVKATRISQGYIANMSGGKKENPSAAYLRRIAKFLGISVDDFYRPPPPEDQLEALRGISQAARAALMRQIKEDGE